MTYFTRIRLKPEGPPLFELGRVVATPGAMELMRLTDTSPLVLIAKHVSGNWGDCDPEDVQTNNEALRHGSRVMSVYRLPLMAPTASSPDASGGGAPGTGARPAIAGVDDDRIWVITEADRSVTTFLLPEEY
jgi:hypothetical protein